MRLRAGLEDGAELNELLALRPAMVAAPAVRDEDQRRSRDLDVTADHHQARIPLSCATPSVGLLAVAYGFAGMRPARKASRPASTPLRIAAAIRGGSCD